MPPSVTRLGPVTRRLQTRTAMIYAAVLLLGALPLLLNAGPGWQAFGQGLWLPGGGFIALGGAWALLFPVVALFFLLAVFFWFGAGMVVAPVLVWIIAAVAAGLLAGDRVWAVSPVVNLALVAAGLAFAAYRRAKTVKAGAALYEQKKAALPARILDAQAASKEADPIETRELTEEQLMSLRYVFERALQPDEEWNGYDIVDEFQPAARRYQVNRFSYTLGTAQTHYTPSFHGYLSEAQRALLDKSTRLEVWKYWVYEAAWGQLNFRNFDPAGKDNIMLTAFLNQAACLYMSASGDRSYAEPGAFEYRLNDRTVFRHDAHTFAKSVADNMKAAPLCLYPCEPNWVYAICNHIGMGSLVIYDRLFGSNYAEELLPRWLEMLDTEMTDASGTIIALRSTYTGFQFTFPGSDAAYAAPTNVFRPERALRMWSSARGDVMRAVKDGPDGRPRLLVPGPGFDPGTYSAGTGFALAGAAFGAREFGDTLLADAAMNSIDETCGRVDDGGVLRYTRMSNLANAALAQAKVTQKNFWRDAMIKGPPEACLRGPLLEDAVYPDVLVARAFSDGDNLDLILRPGRAPGLQTLGVGRLQPGRRYAIEGAMATEIVADAAGKARFTVNLAGRTPVKLTPVSA